MNSADRRKIRQVVSNQSHPVLRASALHFTFCVNTRWSISRSRTFPSPRHQFRNQQRIRSSRDKGLGFNRRGTLKSRSVPYRIFPRGSERIQNTLAAFQDHLLRPASPVTPIIIRHSGLDALRNEQEGLSEGSSEKFPRETTFRSSGKHRG